MPAPRAGRPTAADGRDRQRLLNSVGLQGPGIDAFLQRDLPWLLSRGARVVVSMPADHGRVRGAGRPAVRRGRGDAIEVNMSCPNAAERGQLFALDPQRPAA